MHDSHDQPQSSQVKPRPRGIYLLPNLFTTTALLSGFYAVLAAVDGRFETAAVAIFVAMILDGLDGRVARLTNTQSAFGAEYDSLSDMVAFGLAPSLVIHVWALRDLGRPGWIVAFVFTAAAALRLARFNTQVGKADKRYFQGLPSPAAAAIVASFLWVCVDLGIGPEQVAWVAAALTLISGLLMVSNIRFHSFKDIDPRGKVPFIALVVVMLAFGVIIWHPPLVLFFLFLCYALSGPLLTLVEVRKRRAKRRRDEVGEQSGETAKEDGVESSDHGG